MRMAFFINDPVTNSVAAIALSWVRQLATQFPEDRFLVLVEAPFSAFTELDAIEQVQIESVPHRYPFFPIWSDALLYKKLFSFRPDLFISAHPVQHNFTRWKQARITAGGGLLARGIETFFIPFASADYTILGTEEKLAIKEQWTFGREFFMLAGPLPSEPQLTLLLQAFSIFKHRQQSGLRLLLPLSIADHYPSLAKKIDQYKYQDALVITGPIDAAQVAQLAAAAYALVAPGSPGSALLATVQAWRAGIPLLAMPDTSLSTFANESVLIASESTKEALATIMMRIYKDEALRLQLIRNGQQCGSAKDIAEETNRLRVMLQQLVSESLDHTA